MKDYHSRIAGAIAAGLVGILGFLTWALIYRQIPSENDTVLNALVGILSTQVSMVVGYYFGNSVGSARQSVTIETLAKTAQSAQSALAPIPDVVIPSGAALNVKAADETPA